MSRSHTPFIIRLTTRMYGVNGEALQLQTVLKSRISTTSHVRIRISYCKSRALHLNVQ